MGNINGIIISPLEVISNNKGNILHALKESNDSYKGFGEAYFSIVQKNLIKGWKKHSKMTLNLIVPVGNIKFVVFDDRIESKTYGNFFSIILGNDNYKRLTVPPNIWLAFQGVGENLNMLLNIADIEHDPLESINAKIDEIVYDWKL
jgi:dTDP-4-dehydrorhamnose 3,5-epimerase